MEIAIKKKIAISYQQNYISERILICWSHLNLLEDFASFCSDMIFKSDTFHPIQTDLELWNSFTLDSQTLFHVELLRPKAGDVRWWSFRGLQLTSPLCSVWDEGLGPLSVNHWLEEWYWNFRSGLNLSRSKRRMFSLWEKWFLQAKEPVLRKWHQQKICVYIFFFKLSSEDTLSFLLLWPW